MVLSENKEIKNNIELLKYCSELKEDVELNVRNLREKSLMCSSIWAKWLQYLFHEKERLDKIIETKLKVILKKTVQNKQTDSVLRLKSEEKLVNNDETILKLNMLLKNTKDNIDYIERALNILLNFSYQIRNTTDIIKLTDC